jgi:heat shock protein HtpX
MSMYIFRTVLLLAILSAILLAIGLFFGGFLGMTIALAIAIGMNLIIYWFSDKIVLRMYGAKPLKDAKINHMVEKLAKKAGIPKPATYLVDMDVPNAFATGRNPQNAVVAVTQALVDRLEDDEIEGVLAHEIAHIKHSDMLVNTIAASIGAAISWIGYVFWFGTGDDNKNIFSYILLFIAVPLAALLIRLGISRSREYFADQGGAEISGKPLSLAHALDKISKSAKSEPPTRGSAATSSLFIVNPFSGRALLNLFSTHPPVEQRIARLKELAKSQNN